ncbi:dimethyladenosine transferase 2, mitochondrial [Euwallacea similis]|uniref:dimethyladenosine transferase 2, mitochondrial n=1 Tax=Euwallacea similis TaxID=1736056 RepID=UPI00344FD09A
MLLKKILNSVFEKLRSPHKLGACQLCNHPEENSIQNVNSSLPQGKKIRKKRPPFIPNAKHLKEIDDFFTKNPNLQPYKDLLPKPIIEKKPYKPPDLLYLISPDIAKDVANHLTKRLLDKTQVIAESNPGLGLISKSLLQNGFTSIRLYEGNLEFQSYLLEQFQARKDQVKLFKKEFFRLYQYASLDKFDQQGRVQFMLEHLPKRDWLDDPFITVVGCLSKTSFLKFMIKSLVLQTKLSTYGRVELFLLTQKKHWDIFNTELNPRRFRPWNVLMNLFFEAELIDKYPRKFFLPWETSMDKEEPDEKRDPDHIYLIRTILKRDLPIESKDFAPFYCFMMHLYAWGGSSVIQTCEKWVPSCGEYLLFPRLEHKHYPGDLGIFTKFKELPMDEIIPIYKEMASHPNFLSSPFMDMIDQEWLKSETIETDLHDSQIKKTN